MSYDKALAHAGNVKKSRAQGRMHFGFDTGTPWPNPRRDPHMAAWLEVREWFPLRHHGDKALNRECIREAIETARATLVHRDQVKL